MKSWRNWCNALKCPDEFNGYCKMKNIHWSTKLNTRQTGWQLWWTIVNVALVIIVYSSVQAQTPTPEQLVGTWIGVRAEFDEQFDRPYPVSMTLGADSTYLLRLLDENPPGRRATWSADSQKIRLDTNTYAVGQWTIQRDELRLTGAIPLAFRRFVDIPIDSVAAGKVLSGHVWATDSLTYRLRATGDACLENSRTGTVALHCWRLARVGQSLFLVVKGNQDGCKGNFQYPLQITELSTTAVYCLGGNGQSVDQLVFRRVGSSPPNEVCQPNGFQPCNTYAFSSFNLYPYYTFTRGRLYDIRQVVERAYKPVARTGQSGLIRFRFIVNCRGEAGQFHVLEVDESYQKRPFDPRITDQLLVICRDKLTGWEAGRPTGEPNQEPVDTFCLLTFRLKDGLITDIFP